MAEYVKAVKASEGFPFGIKTQYWKGERQKPPDVIYNKDDE